MTFGTGGSMLRLRQLGRWHLDLLRQNLVPPPSTNIYWYACCLSFGSGISNACLWATTTTLGILLPLAALFWYTCSALSGRNLERPSLGNYHHAWLLLLLPRSTLPPAAALSFGSI
jgi:hypothetical protein